MPLVMGWERLAAGFLAESSTLVLGDWESEVRYEITRLRADGERKDGRTVSLILPVGPAKETKIVAPHEAAIFNITSSSRVPWMTVTFGLLEIAVGTLSGLRTYSVRV